jgi:glycosyltransferase involved in cell wall biosynthesis
MGKEDCQIKKQTKGKIKAILDSMENQQYKISIIIPIYNGESCISRAFDSIRNQTIGFRSLEVILVNDASSDGSSALIDGFAAEHENVKAIHLAQNSGFGGRPRNVGLKEASGEYLMLLDQDDVYYEDACERLYAKAIATKADIVCGYYSVHRENGETVYDVSYLHKDVAPFFIKSAHEYPEVFEYRIGLWAKLYHRRLLTDHGIAFREDTPVDDIIFFAELAMVMDGFQYDRIPVVRYTLRDSDDKSLTYTVNAENMQAVGWGFEKLYEVFARHGKPEYFQYIIRGSAYFYTKILLNDDLSQPEKTVAHLKALHFIYEKAKEQRLYSKSVPAEVVSCLVSSGEYETAVSFLAHIQSLRKRSEKYRRLKEKYERLRKKHDKLQKRLKNSRILQIIGKLRGWKLG